MPARTATRSLTESEIKLLSSIPEIESSVFEMVKTLSALVSESANREVRLKNRIDELVMQITGLKEEVVAMKESAIATASVTSPPAEQQPQMQSTTRRKGSRSRTRRDQVTKCTGAAAGEHRSAFKRVHVDDTGSDREISSEEDESFQTVGRPPVKPQKTSFDPIADESWKLVSKEPHQTRKAVVYVGNLHADCTEERVTEFTQQRSVAVAKSVKVHECSMHTTEDGKVSARLTLDATGLETVTAANFWPRPLYARAWRHRKRPQGDSSSGAAGAGNVGSRGDRDSEEEAASAGAIQSHKHQ